MMSRSRATDNRFYGVFTGIVTSVLKDQTKEGRVIVKLPWFDDQTELECRVCQIYAGKGYGAFFVPEERDEVLIAFIQGDMRFPIILGGLYNGVDKPPTFRATDKDQKMIRTKGGHQLILDDTSDAEKIIIVDKSSNNSIEINSVGDAITISAKTGKLTLHAKEIDIKADGTLNIEGATINLN
jgi:uncharacterized protein involved in type VI secretion and phage assembly